MSRRSPRPVAAPVLAALALGMVAGCGAVTGAKPAVAQSTAGPASTPLPSCGTARTAAGVPVEIEIKHGPVPCPAALAVVPALLLPRPRQGDEANANAGSGAVADGGQAAAA